MMTLIRKFLEVLKTMGWKAATIKILKYIRNRTLGPKKLSEKLKFKTDLLNAPNNQKKEITYLCQETSRTLGGVKVIYKHSEFLATQGVASSVFHPNNESLCYSWFEHKTAMRKNRPFSRLKDFVVIPEFWALPFAEKCLEHNCGYAIFVQNGYLLNAGVSPEDYERLKKVYNSANLILSISDDTTEIIRIAYPNIEPQKIIRVTPNIAECFVSSKKEKIISYMPRKLAEHSQKLCFYLKENLPNNWKLLPIENLSEQQVAQTLGHSSIFLSFSDQEGFALPPLEAALSGALVIGYTGQGAKEYFNSPNFIEIQNGDFKSFFKAVVSSMSEIDNGLLKSEAFLTGIRKLRDSYGRDSEQRHLLLFAKAVEQVKNQH